MRVLVVGEEDEGTRHGLRRAKRIIIFWVTRRLLQSRNLNPDVPSRCLTYLATILQYVKTNKENDNDWFKLECNKEGTRYACRKQYVKGFVATYVFFVSNGDVGNDETMELVTSKCILMFAVIAIILFMPSLLF